MAKAVAEHALSLDPTIVSAHATLGAVFFNQGKFDESEAAFQKALTMNPNHSFGHHWYSHLLLARGELDRSLEEIDLAVQLDPLSFITVLIASIWHSFAADYEEAFRPIFLTTITTFGGLTPIILESSRQAAYLIPMAISLGFGIVFATSIILVLVPCFYMVLEDIKGIFYRTKE